MIVVVIVGILGVVASPSIMDAVQRTKTAEGGIFLGQIRQKQENYRSDYMEYMQVCGGALADLETADDWSPAVNLGENPGVPGKGNLMPWAGSDQCSYGDPPVINSWDTLGAEPDGPVRFQYMSIAGPPGDTPVPSGQALTDFWYLSQAQVDLDQDGTYFVLESYSTQSQLYVGRRADASAATALTQMQGWE